MLPLWWLQRRQPRKQQACLIYVNRSYISFSAYTITVFAQVFLVTFTANDTFSRSFGIFDGFFNGDNPTISLLLGGSFEGVPMAVDLEEELIEALLCDIGGITLNMTVSSQVFEVLI